jgi:hypothetical protein
MGARNPWFLRAILIAAALFMIEGGLLTDLIGLGGAVGVYLIQKLFHPKADAQIDVKGLD